MAYFYAACAVRVTIFSTGGKFCPISNFTELHALESQVALLLHTNDWHIVEIWLDLRPITNTVSPVYCIHSIHSISRAYIQHTVMQVYTDVHEDTLINTGIYEYTQVYMSTHKCTMVY